MAVELKREAWLQLFDQMSTPDMFLSSLFTVKPGGIYNGTKVAIDIMRSGEEVAVAIRKCTGVNLNDISEFTTKEFTPPAYGEEFPVESCELLNRDAGVDPYSAAYETLAVSFVKLMMRGFSIIDNKIKRGVELQAAQILQTGKLNLTNASGDTTYELDFKPKSTHFPTVGTAWSAAGADPLGDLESLAKVIRADGHINPDMLIMGSAALDNFLSNDKVIERLDNRRMELGSIDPRFLDSGATLYGTVQVGTYRFDIWTYPSTFTDPATKLTTEYVDADKVIMLSSRTRLDKSFARVPILVRPDPRVANLLPTRLDSAAMGMDLTPNVYTTADGMQVFGQLHSRPLLIPVQIDGFACLNTKP